jgi:hypothetical protein
MHETLMNQSPPPPWYRQFWPWALIALPATAVIASIATLIIAVKNPDGLVVGDYYKQGLAINQTLARDRHARFLGLHAEGRIDQSGRVLLQLSGQQPTVTERLKLSLLHPTRAHQDQIIWLNVEDANRETFTGQLAQPGPGHWYVLLEPEDEQWRLTGRLTWPGSGELVVEPARMDGE